MDKIICKNCAKFRQFFYKGNKCLMPSDIGRCKNSPYPLTETKNSCELFIKRQDEQIINARQRQAFKTLYEMLNIINELMLILISDRK